MRYTLMNKDECVLTFETAQTETGRTVVRNESVINQEMLPLSYKGNIKNYINKRKAPKYREHIAKLLIQLGAENIDGYIKVCNAASLTDTFWIRNEDLPLTWSEVSLFQNEFDENIAKIALDGGDASIGSTSPELSVNGQYAKCWIRENNKLYLIKRGSQHYRQREVQAEYYASQIIEILCRDSVKYELVSYHDRIASKCSIFTNEDMGFSSISNFFNSESGTEPEEFLRVITQFEDGENYRRMVVSDALILNIDRHLGNFGFLIDNTTQKPIRMAPVFDFNRSMRFNLSHKQFAEEDISLGFATPFTEGGFVENAREMLTPDIAADLKNLRGFKFRKSGIEDWQDDRLEKYEQFIERQIDEILGRTVVTI